MSNTQATATSKLVAGRRTLRFESPVDFLRDAEMLAAGPMVVLGRWSPGQIFLHLARGLDMAIDGGSVQPWYVRLVGRFLLKRRVLAQTMPAGWKAPDHTLVPGETTIEAGLKALRDALTRYQATTARRPHPVFGPLSSTEWDVLQCRHAELHLGFLLPESRIGVDSQANQLTTPPPHKPPTFPSR